MLDDDKTMKDEQISSGTVEFFAPRLFRFFMPLGAACGSANVALSVYRLAVGDSGVQAWLGLFVGGWLAAYFGWVSVASWRHPVVRVTDTAVEFRQIGSVVHHRVLIEELIALRWQDSFDLRLCTRSGAEHALRVMQLAKKDRSRFVEMITERIKCGSLVI